VEVVKDMMSKSMEKVVIFTIIIKIKHNN